MIDGIKAEKESTQNTAESFSVIQRNSVSIQNSIEELTSNTTDLRNSNIISGSKFLIKVNKGRDGK